jgi:hypothetical protein
MTKYTGTCDIMTIDLLYILDSTAKCVCCYMGFGSNSCFVTSASLTSDHYRMYIINSVGHLMSDSVGLLMLWTVAYNGQGTGIVLQVP